MRRQVPPQVAGRQAGVPGHRRLPKAGAPPRRAVILPGATACRHGVASAADVRAAGRRATSMSHAQGDVVSVAARMEAAASPSAAFFLSLSLSLSFSLSHFLYLFLSLTYSHSLPFS